MITETELLALINKHEADQVELTTSISNSDKFAEAICAFANDLPNHQTPGYLIIGVTDDKKYSGAAITDELLKNLAAIRSEGNISPIPVTHVKKFILDAGEVAVVEVFPSDIPPLRYKGKVHIRIGPRRGYASEQEERILVERRTALARTFDALPCTETSITDLSLDLFLIVYRQLAIAPEVLEENHRETSLQLASLRFFHLAKNCPTHAGILMFGKNPLLFLPGAYIQFLRIHGEKLSDEISAEKKISGDLLTVLRKLDELIDVQVLEKPIQVSTLREQLVSDYPKVALRELLMNAIMHRSYESTAPIRFYWFNNRIEIQSPGGLYGEASRENFPKQNAYRNPIIAEAMKILGYVNKFGRGVNRAQEALRLNGHPEASFHFDDNYVLVTLKRNDSY